MLIIAGQSIILIRQLVEKGTYPVSSRPGCLWESLRCYSLPAGRWASILHNIACLGDNEEGG